MKTRTTGVDIYQFFFSGAIFCTSAVQLLQNVGLWILPLKTEKMWKFTKIMKKETIKLLCLQRGQKTKIHTLGHIKEVTCPKFKS